MKNKYGLKIFIGTVSFFIFYYASSVIANTEKTVQSSSISSSSIKTPSNSDVIIANRFQANDLEEIHIVTTSTDIEVRTVASDNINVALKGASTNSSASMQASVINKKLIVKTSENNIPTGYVEGNIRRSLVNRVLIELPPTIKKLRIETVSGDIHVYAANMQSLTASSVSGDLTMVQAQLDSISYESLSGDLFLEGILNKVNVKSISGDVSLKLKNNNPILKIDSASGDVDLNFKEMPNMMLNFSTVSGMLEMNKEFSKDLPEKDKYVAIKFGAGQGVVLTKTISGNLKLGKY